MIVIVIALPCGPTAGREVASVHSGEVAVIRVMKVSLVVDVDRCGRRGRRGGRIRRVEKAGDVGCAGGGRIFAGVRRVG